MYYTAHSRRCKISNRKPYNSFPKKSIQIKADTVDKCGTQRGKEETTSPTLGGETETNLSSFHTNTNTNFHSYKYKDKKIHTSKSVCLLRSPIISFYLCFIAIAKPIRDLWKGTYVP